MKNQSFSLSKLYDQVDDLYNNESIIKHDIPDAKPMEDEKNSDIIYWELRKYRFLSRVSKSPINLADFRQTSP